MGIIYIDVTVMVHTSFVFQVLQTKPKVIYVKVILPEAAKEYKRLSTMNRLGILF